MRHHRRERCHGARGRGLAVCGRSVKIRRAEFRLFLLIGNSARLRRISARRIGNAHRRAVGCYGSSGAVGGGGVVGVGARLVGNLVAIVVVRLAYLRLRVADGQLGFTRSQVRRNRGIRHRRTAGNGAAYQPAQRSYRTARHGPRCGAADHASSRSDCRLQLLALYLRCRGGSRVSGVPRLQRLIQPVAIARISGSGLIASRVYRAVGARLHRCVSDG